MVHSVIWSEVVTKESEQKALICLCYLPPVSARYFSHQAQIQGYMCMHQNSSKYRQHLQT